MEDDNKIYLFDTTLRDGQQTTGVNFSVSDKMTLAKNLDELGVDYIEGGWPGANPTDNDFFSRDLNFSKSKFTAFGMTRKPGRSVENDPGLNSLINTSASCVCIVGKSSLFHVKNALEISKDENIKMISESIQHIKSKNKEAIFDAEHFFDGFKEDREFSINCIKAAYDSGARWVVLCDTNGGTLPDEIFNIVSEVVKIIPGKNVGIHAHNDTENAVANALAAINAGARQVQGTINGLGERCGNTNLISLIPSLVLKTNFVTNIKKDNLKNLINVSRSLNNILNLQAIKNAPYVGEHAFSHKGGLHASAVEKNSSTYEHIEPEIVGNSRNVVISNQAGKSNILNQLNKLNIELKNDDLNKILEKIKISQNVDINKWPKIPKYSRKSNINKGCLNLLKLLLSYCSQESGLAEKLIADADELRSILDGQKTDLKVFSGWRNEIFGKFVHLLMKGEIAFTIKNNKIKKLEL